MHLYGDNSRALARDYRLMIASIDLAYYNKSHAKDWVPGLTKASFGLFLLLCIKMSVVIFVRPYLEDFMKTLISKPVTD